MSAPNPRTFLLAFAFCLSTYAAGCSAGDPEAPSAPGDSVDSSPPPSDHVPPTAPTQAMDSMSPMQMVDVMGMDDKATFGMFSLDRFERVDTDTGPALAWSAQGWVGGDFDRFAFRSEGRRIQGRIDQADVELLWSHAVAPFWDSKLGLRHDVGRGPDRSWFAYGVQGVAPYGIDISTTAYLGEQGRTAVRLEAEYKLLLTQRLVLQPRFELNAYGKGDPSARIGAGVADAELGLRLRYEIRRRFAPYVGVERHQVFGATADLARAVGEERGETQWLAGVRIWF